MFRIFAAIAMWCALAVPSLAQNAEIESTIESQLQAFLQDDFATAYSFADETIKQIFPSPEIFGDMVKNGYPMVHRHSSYEFQELREVAGGLYQNVLIQDQSGNYFVAEYGMRATPEGWKIRSVQILPAPDIGV